MTAPILPVELLLEWPGVAATLEWHPEIALDIDFLTGQPSSAWVLAPSGS
jgi:hypothetical protein